MRNQALLTTAERVVVAAALVLAAVVLWLFAGALLRMLAGMAVLAFAAGNLAFVIRGGHRPIVMSGIALALLLMSPVEVAFINRPGPPGIAPVMMVLADPALRQRSLKGEIVLGGCHATQMEPRWVVVW